MTVSKFEGKRMISVREYYDKKGEMLPGKKVSFLWFFSSSLLF